MRYLLFITIGVILFANTVSARAITVSATAYDNCKKCCGKDPGHPAYGITRSGKRASWGTVAVDPKVIPLGTRMKIEGFDKIFVALDTGGAIKGNKLDVWFPTHREALEFGRKKLSVTLLQ